MEFVVLLHFVLSITLNRVIARPMDTKDGDQRQSEDPYSVNQNGGTQLPPWQPINANMFPTPALRAGDKIIIKGQISDDGLNIQLDTTYGTNQTGTDNFINIFTDGNKVYSQEISSLIYGNEYLIQFHIRDPPNMVEIHLSPDEETDPQYLHHFNIDAQNIKKLTASGRVDKLSFVFNHG